jgi:phospholipid/cholesterol/gamma-HCH transport system ATP-binding protein
MSRNTDNNPAGGAGGKGASGALIRLVGVTKRFGKKTVFDGLDLEFHRGETAVVLGASGVGKSVLLKLILGLLRPDAGRVFVDGQDITDLSERDLSPVRMRFGMLFQGAALFDFMTVYENVAFALHEHTDWPEDKVRERVRQKLALVEMEGTEALLPEELSGGMRKRVGLARAIAIEPEVLLYDEPTTGLDPVTADTINELILRCRRELKTTGLVVTHDMASAYKVGDRLLMLHEGRVIADGPPDAIRAHPDIRVQRFIHGDAGLTESRAQGDRS